MSDTMTAALAGLDGIPVDVTKWESTGEQCEP
jgi:hypothetical protein